ncbi:MAG: hypothetical protein M3161_05875 [Actinomycetota bacterium]|nr:hypothetical protein [Actinomycetota bacterium]
MERSLSATLVAAFEGALGIAAMIFGEADDAPGLVLLGLLMVGGAVAFGVSPALRTRSRIIGFIVGAIALTALVVGIAGWLENNF